MHQRSSSARCAWPLAIALAIALALSTDVVAEQRGVSTPTGPVDFAKDVAPILRRSCIECHGPAKQEGGLRLDGADTESASSVIQPGNLDASEFWRRINLPRGHEEIMPAVGEPLPQNQIEILGRWIKQGAAWPSESSEERHWAHIKPTRAELPSVIDESWIRQPIDRFVLRQIEARGLRPAPRTSPEKLVRRLFLDLIGLPPSVQEVRSFVEDPSDKRLERMVDDLLSRPEFGERWARPWLDAARYADSHGFQRDNLRDMWAYRDWVIRALNDDMPFDQFSIEQIAGDLLPNATASQKIATGFHRCSPTNVEAGSLPEETRTEQVIDRVNTTGAVWLGTTLECCQCHDHKYDPISQVEYYQMLAFFNSTQLEADRTDPKRASSIEFIGPAMDLPDPERDEQRKLLTAQKDELKSKQQARREELANSLEAWASSMSNKLGRTAQNHPLEPAQFISEGPTDSFNRLPDGGILLVGGDPPDTDVYEVHVQTAVKEIRAFRLDALRHKSLPGQGPGRGDATRRNFILNDFTVELRPVANSADSTKSSSRSDGSIPVGERLKFVSASASFSQKGWDVAGAVDDDAKSGWAISPEFDRSHWAMFELEQPLSVPEGFELVFHLHQNFGRSRTIGYFRLSAITGNVSASETVSSEVIAAVNKKQDDRSRADHKLLVDYRVSQDPQSIKLTRAIEKLDKQIAQLAPDTTQVMVELSEARPTMVFERGDYRKLGQPVSPGTPAVLHPLPDGTRDRLALARWLTSPDNPLVARVTVNRWWAELFGEGIVATVEDFGIKGDLPTHPEMLDWLALDLVENGWSMKRWLKSVVLSATYQQSSHITNQLAAVDPNNHLLARGPRMRMDAEMIRDNALAIAGLLDSGRFGPPIRPPQPDGIWSKVGGTAYNYETSPEGERHRRGIYVVLKRGTPYPSFVNFDATARQTCTLRRSRTNTPLQALTLLNDPVYVEAAQALAERMQGGPPDQSLDSRIDAMFQLCTARLPNAQERATLRELYVEQLAASRQRSEKQDSDAPNSAAELAAWSSVATVLLNLHETITKD